ncbi:Hypothetical protein PBC10988_38780 [Planctomycetales bacterium 10988]|nr:Hypothetical protein PBC10988_38780 [Planctomycetales bacterium 10988]
MSAFGLIVLGVLGILVAILAAWLIIFRIYYIPVCVRGFSEVPWLASESNEPIADAEAVSFLSRDGVQLEGSFLKATTSPQGTIIFCHGLSGDRWTSRPYIEPLRKEGYNAFVFDFRNHGNSEKLNDYEPMFWLGEFELFDAQAAVDYVANRQDCAGLPIGLLGISRGGSAAMAAAATHEKVNAVATDGAFGVMEMLLFLMRRYVRIVTGIGPLILMLPTWFIKWHLYWGLLVIEKKRPCRFIRLESLAPKIKQPTLMIHGGDDKHIPLSVSKALADRLPNLVDYEVIPKAKHNQGHLKSPEHYQELLKSFFDEHLAAPPALHKKTDPNSPPISTPEIAS